MCQSVLYLGSLSTQLRMPDCVRVQLEKHTIQEKRISFPIELVIEMQLQTSTPCLRQATGAWGSAFRPGAGGFRSTSPQTLVLAPLRGINCGSGVGANTMNGLTKRKLVKIVTYYM